MSGPRILVTGRGGAASWEVRSVQIGAALGATVKPNATIADMRAHDVVLVTKKVPDELRHALQRCGRPWVYDIVDAYPQRTGAGWTREQCVRWLRDWLGMLQPHSVIWPTDQMRQDGLTIGRLGPTIYHHARAGQPINPIRERVDVVAYDGSPRYIERWHAAILRECKARGWGFLVNPTKLADADIVLALRDAEWQSYAMRAWKSNVKLANAHATGTPFVGQIESGYRETNTGAEAFIETPDMLGKAFDLLADQSTRATVSAQFLKATISVEQVSAQFRDELERVARL